MTVVGETLADWAHLTGDAPVRIDRARVYVATRTRKGLRVEPMLFLSVAEARRG